MRQRKNKKRIAAFVLSAALLISGVTITGAMDPETTGFESMTQDETESMKENTVGEVTDIDTTERIQETGETHDGENINDSRNKENEKSTEVTGNDEESGNAATPENTEETECIETPENTEKAEGTEIPEDTGKTETTETPEDTEETETTEIPKDTEEPGNTKAEEQNQELQEEFIPDIELAAFFEPERTLGDNLEYEKTAHLTNWDNREYEISITADSLASSETTVTKKQTIDVMMVFDLSGSMNQAMTGQNRLQDIGYYSSVEGQMDQEKTYYVDTYQNSWYGGSVSTGMANSPISKIAYAKYPVRYLDGSWQKYINGQWKAVSENDVIATWDSRLTALKDAASAFVVGVSRNSADSKVGLAAFYGKTVRNEYVTVGELKKNLNASENEQLIRSIAELYADGGTSPQKGLEIAGSQFENAADENKKYVILFSDGEPSENDDTIQTESQAEILKNAGYTVITVGLGLTKDTADWLKNKVASEKYAYTATSASELKKIFEDIQQTITQSCSLYDVTVQDVIDSRFEITANEKERLVSQGAVITENDDGTTTVSWSGQEIKAKEDQNHGWSRTIHVKAKDDFIGGNNIATNIADASEIRQDGQKVSLQQPIVNVKMNFNLTDTQSTIFLGETIEKYFNNAQSELKNSKTDTELIFYRDEACTKELSSEELEGEKPKDATHYYVKGRLPAEASKEEAKRNSTIDGVVYENDTAGVWAIPKDGKAYAAVYDVSVETGNLTIMKKINKNAIRKDEGDPVFTFKITNESTGRVYYKTLRFDGNEDSVKEGVFDTAEKTTLSGLPQGIYRIEELKTMGFSIKDYAIGEETNCDSFASGDYVKTAIGLCAGENADWNSTEGFTSEPDDGHLLKNCVGVIVRNKKTRSSGKLTDTDVVKNHFVLGSPVEKKPDADNGCNTVVWK